MKNQKLGPKDHVRKTRDQTSKAGDTENETRHILVVGSINMDLVVRCDRMPAPGETVPGSDFTTTPGGKGANQAVAASRLGSKTWLVGSVGRDVFGERLLESLRREGIESKNVRVVDNVSSGIAVIQVDSKGENAITLAPGANGALGSAQIEEAAGLFETAEVLLLQLEIPVDAVEKAVLLARRAGLLTVLDPAPAPANGLPPALFDVDILSPNQSEAGALTGIAVYDIDSARRAARLLRDKGARNVVLKMGDSGALYVGEHGECYVQALEVNVVDTTAAGDAFTAALAVGFAEGMPVKESMRFACAAGALAVTKPGAQEAMPTRPEVERLLSTF